jgi:hypothetical protein
MRIRRRIVQGCVCIQKNLLGDREWEDELRTGLVEQGEVERLKTATRPPTNFRGAPAWCTCGRWHAPAWPF